MATLTHRYTSPQQRRDRLHELAWALSADGFDGHEDGIAEVVRWARAASVSPVVVDVLADPTEIEVARLRAFGLVATALATIGEQAGDIAA